MAFRMTFDDARDVADFERYNEPSGRSGATDDAWFVAGTRIETPKGWIPVETLVEGDLVVTRDGASLPVIKVLTRHISGSALGHDPNLAPVTLPPTDGFDQLYVSGATRMVMEGWEIELLFGMDAAFIPAESLSDRGSASAWIATGITYCQIILPEHAVVHAEGQWCESYFVNENDEELLDEDWGRAARGLDPVPNAVLAHTQTALPCLCDYEIEAFLEFVARRSSTKPTAHQHLRRA